jgi:hypothetical protein
MDAEFADQVQQTYNGAEARTPGFWKKFARVIQSPTTLFVFLLALSLIFAAMISKGGVVVGILLIILMIGVPVIYGVVAYPNFGILVLFIAGYLLFIPMKMDTGGFPLGTVMDCLEYLLILGFFVKQKNDSNWSMFTDRLSFFTLIWIEYNFVEIANPSSISPLAWVYTIRTTAVIIFMYFVFVYQIRQVSFIKLLFKIWIVLAFIGAADGFKQENFGYFQFEHDYLYGDPVKLTLLFIDGHMRKFSIFSDPVAFAYNMATASILCITLMFGPIKTYKKYILGVIVAFCMFCMLYSGTRGAFPLIPAALILLAILNYNRKVLIFALCAAAFFLALIFVPTSNGSIVRFQSAFKPNNDPSFNLRKMNQARIRPFIMTHPMGGGLGTTGMWGQKFAPGSMLANFPPDSGYVRVAVETGTIGILLLCSMVFVALLTGINNFYTIRDPVLKNYNLAATLVVFTYNIGNYPQEAIVQFPSNVIFFLCMALITICKRLDNEKQKALANAA